MVVVVRVTILKPPFKTATLTQEGVYVGFECAYLIQFENEDRARVTRVI